MKCSSLLIPLAAACAISTASAQVLVNETFDSYATTAQMQANWGAAGLGTLDTAMGNPGNSAAHPGGAVNSWVGGPISLIPTASQWIRLTADIYDDGTSNNERITVGLRNGANPLFEMGHYNSSSEHYHVRVLAMYGANNWVPIQTGLRAASGQPAGWNRYEALFTDTQLIVSLDLGADGTIDGTFTSAGLPSATPFVDLRFGGPSNLSSAGGGVRFDNIRLEIVPEPSTVALFVLGLGALTACRARRQ